MQSRTLVKNSNKYIGKYVALQSFNHRDVVASGKDPLDVVARAEAKGFKSPVIVYIPQKGSVHIY